MKQIPVNYKTDFKAILDFDGGWGSPFELRFWSNSPSRSFVASYDGHQYINCHVESDGRLCIGFDHHNMGFGELKVDPIFYLNDQCFADKVYDEHLDTTTPVFVDEKGEKYTVVLGMTGMSEITLIGTLPPAYMQGPEGKQGKQGVQGIPGKDGKDGAPGKDGKDGQDGAPGKDGKDGGLIYPSYKVDPHNMHLYSDTDTNRVALSKDKHFTVKF